LKCWMFLVLIWLIGMLQVLQPARPFAFSVICGARLALARYRARAGRLGGISRFGHLTGSLLSHGAILTIIRNTSISKHCCFSLVLRRAASNEQNIYCSGNHPQNSHCVLLYRIPCSDRVPASLGRASPLSRK
jgi:hypothetical protein